MAAYYNECDPYCAWWLRNLIEADWLPAGDVDDRPIEEVSGDELKGYTQAHLFAGIGGWPYAIRLAGWPDEWPIWSGSCPCQPFSQAGQQRGERDPRDLWPEFRRLVQECSPPVVFGEQVASALGREWLARVRSDLEDLDYAVGGADLCAAGCGAPHTRQRLWWVAHNPEQYEERGGLGEIRGRTKGGSDGHTGGMGDSSGQGARRDGGAVPGAEERSPMRAVGDGAVSPGPANHWRDAVWIECADGKARRIEPGIEPLVNGIPNRVAKLRAIGNSIVPQVAAEFIKAYMECEERESGRI